MTTLIEIGLLEQILPALIQAAYQADPEAFRAAQEKFSKDNDFDIPRTAQEAYEAYLRDLEQDESLGASPSASLLDAVQVGQQSAISLFDAPEAPEIAPDQNAGTNASFFGASSAPQLATGDDASTEDEFAGAAAEGNAAMAASGDMQDDGTWPALDEEAGVPAGADMNDDGAAMPDNEYQGGRDNIVLGDQPLEGPDNGIDISQSLQDPGSLTLDDGAETPELSGEPATADSPVIGNDFPPTVEPQLTPIESARAALQELRELIDAGALDGLDLSGTLHAVRNLFEDIQDSDPNEFQEFFDSLELRDNESTSPPGSFADSSTMEAPMSDAEMIEFATSPEGFGTTGIDLLGFDPTSTDFGGWTVVQADMSAPGWSIWGENATDPYTGVAGGWF